MGPDRVGPDQGWGSDMQNRMIWILVAALIVTGTTAARADDPRIENLVVQQRSGSYEVEIQYDLNCLECDSVYVQAFCSVDGGATWPLACRTVSGDIGAFVRPGTGLTAVWDAAADLPGIYTESARVRVVAAEFYPAPYVAGLWRSSLDDKNKVAFAKADTFSFAQNDTIAFGESFRLGWDVTAPVAEALTPEMVAARDTVVPYDDALLGYQYLLPGEVDWQPRLFDESTGDSVLYFAPTESVAFFNDGSGPDARHRLLENGFHRIQLNALDIVGSEIPTQGRDFWFVVNYDPETLVLDGETDWEHPEDPQLYPYYVSLDDPLQIKVPFVSGERIPDRSYVVCKALMRDDARDLLLDPGHEVGLSGYVEGTSTLLNGALYSFQTPSSQADVAPTWPAGPNGWTADTLGFLVAPSTQMTVNLRAVDEHGRRDGTPAQLTFDVGYPPCVQCLEVVSAGEASAFDASTACYTPGEAHPCFGDTAVFYVKESAGTAIAGREYLWQEPDLSFLAIDRESLSAEVVEDTLGLGATAYLIPMTTYAMETLYHGRDDSRESWQDPIRRIGAWRSQIDHDCDPNNDLIDGGGYDDLSLPNWGNSYEGDLTIGADGVWRNRVRVHIPTSLLTGGVSNYRLQLFVNHIWGPGVPFDLNHPLIDVLYGISIREAGLARISAIALDQTICMTTPLRPGSYHTFHNLRPDGDQLGAYQTWRDCSGLSGVSSSIPLADLAMMSSGGVPAERYYRIVIQAGSGTGEDVECVGTGF